MIDIDTFIKDILEPLARCLFWSHWQDASSTQELFPGYWQDASSTRGLFTGYWQDASSTRDYSGYWQDASSTAGKGEEGKGKTGERAKG
ncbi:MULTISPECIES: hypothetical protein [unclassified Moorena]|uniref:hypothetical protein n=1 Tax=unclassified Moorena TaxID=2683338 RepID=UPI0013FF85CD|nr:MULTISPECIES: hypothetical protein [unclassified Moorena]NEO13029.1 hypothetical protein [Moorena sp. SIO3E8]NEQ00244.1 hypothetical protein [Moorena sp. SIO3F7]